MTSSPNNAHVFQQHLPQKLIDLIPNSIEYHTVHTLKQTQQWITNQVNRLDSK